MRVVGALDEAVAQNGHFVHLKSVGGHNFEKLLQTVLKEIKLSLLGVHIQETISDHGQAFHDQLNDAEALLGAFTATRSLGAQSRVNLSQSSTEEGEQLRQVHHTLGKHQDNIVNLVLQSQEDINDNLIRNVLESLSKVADTALWVLFEDLVLRVHLVELIGQIAANHISQDLLQGLLIRVLINLSCTIITFVVCFLAHLPNLFVDSLNGDRFDIADKNTVNSLLVLDMLGFVLRVLE